jgi:hypothetical protein
MGMMRVPSSRGAWAMTTRRPPSKPRATNHSPPIGKTIVFEGDARPGKYLLGIFEAETMLREVVPIFRFIPFVLHFRLFENVTRFVVTGKSWLVSHRWVEINWGRLSGLFEEWPARFPPVQKNQHFVYLKSQNKVIV